jgi:hypothetical protein
MPKPLWMNTTDDRTDHCVLFHPVAPKMTALERKVIAIRRKSQPQGSDLGFLPAGYRAKDVPEDTRSSNLRGEIEESLKSGDISAG